MENSSASYNFAGSVLASTCADGFGDAPVVNGSSAISSGARYSVKQNPGKSFTVICTPNAKVTGAPMGSYSYAGVNVAYNATATPVEIILGGTTRFNDVNNVLIGQEVEALLSTGFPQKMGSHRWTIGGDPFGGFVTTATSGNAVELTTADKQGAGVVYFYRSVAGGTKTQSTITCSATITFPTLPNGTDATVTATKNIMVYPPTKILFDITSGTMGVNGTAPNQSLNPYTVLIMGGMQWAGSVLTPVDFAFFAGGSGSWGVAQLATPVVVKNGIADLQNGSTGLEDQFPFHIHMFDADGTTKADTDNPKLLLNGIQNTAEFDCTFQTFLLYSPPALGNNLVTWVPLKRTDWKFSGSAYNLMQLWLPGLCSGITVTGPSATSTLPIWTQVVTVPH